MNTIAAHTAVGTNRYSDRDTKRLRNATARRKLQTLRDRKMLRRWLTEVWDEPAEGHTYVCDNHVVSGHRGDFSFPNQNLTRTDERY